MLFAFFTTNVIFQNISLAASGPDVHQLRPEHGSESAVPVLPGRLVGALPVGQELKHSLLQVINQKYYYVIIEL